MKRRTEELRQAPTRLPVTEYDRLARVAKRYDRSVAAQIRVAIREHVEREEER
jgi:hypothetical protein